MLLYSECRLHFYKRARFLGKGRLCGILWEDIAPPLGSGAGGGGEVWRRFGGEWGQGVSARVQWNGCRC